MTRTAEILNGVRSQGRALLRWLAIRFGGLPHSSGTVDSPPPHVAHDITELWKRNTLSRASIVEPGSAESVSMTSHGERLRNTWVAIESIGRGTVRPGRLILWLDQPRKRLPWRLRRLQRRGLEVIYVEPGLRVHTKYWPYVTSAKLGGPLVLADDDIVYPPTWLQGLRTAHAESPGCIVAYRAHTIAMTSPSEFAPYTTWPSCEDASPSYAHFATTVSGQLLPLRIQEALRDEGPGFLMTSPTSDDLWIHRAGVLHGFPTRQVAAGQQHWWFIPGSQTTGLNAVNVIGGENDRQMAASHDARTRERIWDDYVRLTN